MGIDQVDGGWDFDGWVDDGSWWLCGLMMEGWVLIVDGGWVLIGLMVVEFRIFY